MSKKAVVYGAVVPETTLVQLTARASAASRVLELFREPTLVRADGAELLVFVDLEDSSLCRPDFLVSLATGGKQVRVIGKAAALSVDDTIRFSKMGVAEVLTEEQCLKRLETFLGTLEELPEIPTSDSRFGLSALVGSSTQIINIKSTIEVLAQVDFPSALILGDTGTGKSLISKVLHHTGTRREQNLVEVNCSAIPDELFESELFGYARGAFTDARSDKMGLFEFADNGTLFLDEIGNLSLSAQAKLLKILEDKKLRRIGDVAERNINVRVVAATNRNLEDAINEGSFRQDLYFRLNLLTLEIPPLRERPEDVPYLAEHYLRLYAALYGKPHLTLGDGAAAALSTHSWPGNVRELSNIIERGVLLAQKDRLERRDILAAMKSGRLTVAERGRIVIDLPAQGLTLADIEKQVVKHVLDMFDWNKTETAAFLGISRPRLRRLIDASRLEQNRRQL